MTGKEYRQSAHVASLIAWAILCLLVAVFLLFHQHELLDRKAKLAEFLGAIALFVLGPVATAIYLYRAQTLWVQVDGERGILVRGRHLLSWEEIVRIERRWPRLRSRAGPAQVPPLKLSAFKGGGLDLIGCDGCLDVFGEGAVLGLAVLLILGALLLAVWLIFFVLIPLLIIPVIEVFSPWGDRVVIVTGKRKLLLRDLQDADGFLREVGNRVPLRQV